MNLNIIVITLSLLIALKVYGSVWNNFHHFISLSDRIHQSNFNYIVKKTFFSIFISSIVFLITYSLIFSLANKIF